MTSSLPPVPPELLQFPCSFPIKVMGACANGFAEAIAEVVRSFDPEFDPATMEMRPSRHGNYLGLTVTVMVHSREQLDNIYRALTGHPMVKIVL
ncbi:MAG: DUF493 family protein [Burkholderiaceae bacterium]|jgi:putative lipoic acid-binding regulatory protein